MMARASGKLVGFSLIELLVVIAMIALLVSMLLPTLSAARERARVVKVQAELRGIETALEAYLTENGAYPPVHVSCNTDLWRHFCQLPPELARGGYFPSSDQPGLQTCLEDEFHPGFTYKYAAPGDVINNLSLMKKGNYVWVPDRFPYDRLDGDVNDTADGRLYNDPDESPVVWVVYSLGPDPEAEKSWSPRAPIARNTWYGHLGDTGVIARIKTNNGTIASGP